MINLHGADFATLIETFLFSFPRVRAQNVYAKRLSGGFSGAVVGLTWSDDLPPLIVKASPSQHVVKECAGRASIAKSNEKVASKLRQLEALGLSDVSPEIEVNVGRRTEAWRALVYLYSGAVNPGIADEWVDFQTALEQMVHSGRYSEDLLRRWLDHLTQQLRLPAGGPARPLSYFLPAVAWDEFVNPVLHTAAAFVCTEEARELSEMEGWWRATTSRSKGPAAVQDHGPIHGDLRFANILVEPTTSAVELIDFGSAREGHVFADLAKFECDVLLRLHADPNDANASEAMRLEVLNAAAHRGLAPDAPKANKHLDVFRTLREVYDNRWHFTPQCFSMYRWFVLAELLKRLRWFEDVFASPSGRVALLRAILLMKRAEERLERSPMPFGLLSLTNEMGCTAVYVPNAFSGEANARRNRSKRAALKASKDVRILAETGNAFLHCINQKGAFFEDVHALLKAGGSFRAVVANPYFIEGFGISRAFAAGNRDENGIHETLTEKYRQTRRGHEELRHEFGERIQVRVAHFGLSSSLLLLDSCIFLEPYFYVDRGHRARHQFDTFELELNSTSSVARLFEGHFDFHWTHSTPLDDVEKRQDAFLAALRSMRALTSPVPE
jgi:hypothetical protein